MSVGIHMLVADMVFESQTKGFPHGKNYLDKGDFGRWRIRYFGLARTGCVLHYQHHERVPTRGLRGLVEGDVLQYPGVHRDGGGSTGVDRSS